MANKTLAQIQKQIDSLQREADAIVSKEKAGVIDRVKEQIARYGLTAAELGLGAVRRKPGPKPGSKRKAGGAASKKAAGSAKYKDAAGNSWSGRGPKPAWFKAALAAGSTPEDLLA